MEPVLPSQLAPFDTADTTPQMDDLCRQIEQTRDGMSQTIDEIQGRLTPSHRTKRQAHAGRASGDGACARPVAGAGAEAGAGAGDHCCGDGGHRHDGGRRNAGGASFSGGKSIATDGGGLDEAGDSCEDSLAWARATQVVAPHGAFERLG
jgi:Protein of unknown function (DUF3618)